MNPHGPRLQCCSEAIYPLGNPKLSNHHIHAFHQFASSPSHPNTPLRNVTPPDESFTQPQTSPKIMRTPLTPQVSPFVAPSGPQDRYQHQRPDRAHCMPPCTSRPQTRPQQLPMNHYIRRFGHHLIFVSVNAPSLFRGSRRKLGPIARMVCGDFFISRFCEAPRGDLLCCHPGLYQRTCRS